MGSSSVDRESHTSPKFLCRDWDVLSVAFNEAVAGSRDLPRGARATWRSISTLFTQSGGFARRRSLSKHEIPVSPHLATRLVHEKSVTGHDLVRDPLPHRTRSLH